MGRKRKTRRFVLHICIRQEKQDIACELYIMLQILAKKETKQNYARFFYHINVCYPELNY